MHSSSKRLRPANYAPRVQDAPVPLLNPACTLLTRAILASSTSRSRQALCGRFSALLAELKKRKKESLPHLHPTRCLCKALVELYFVTFSVEERGALAYELTFVRTSPRRYANYSASSVATEFFGDLSRLHRKRATRRNAGSVRFATAVARRSSDAQFSA